MKKRLPPNPGSPFQSQSLKKSDIHMQRIHLPFILKLYQIVYSIIQLLTHKI